MNTTPRVWIADLAAYNAGFLHGEWVDATDIDEMNEAGERIIKSSPVWKLGMNAEELAIHDYDGFPSEIVADLGEYPNWKTVVRIANGLEDHGPAFSAWLVSLDYGDGYEDLDERFQESYRGEWDSEQAYAMEAVCELGWANVPGLLFLDGNGGDDKRNRINVFDELAGYLNWETIAREMFQHGSYSYVDGYVFEDMNY